MSAFLSLSCCITIVYEYTNVIVMTNFRCNIFKIFQHFRKSISSKQSKTSLEQDKLRNADILIQQETNRTRSK